MTGPSGGRNDAMSGDGALVRFSLFISAFQGSISSVTERVLFGVVRKCDRRRAPIPFGDSATVGVACGMEWWQARQNGRDFPRKQSTFYSAFVGGFGGRSRSGGMHMLHHCPHINDPACY